MSLGAMRPARKLRPPWIQTQLDQGYRPYSFYVEYQRTTPLSRAAAAAGVSEASRGDLITAASTTTPPPASSMITRARIAPTERSTGSGKTEQRTSAGQGNGEHGQDNNSSSNDNNNNNNNNSGDMWYRTGAARPIHVEDDTKSDRRPALQGADSDVIDESASAGLGPETGTGDERDVLRLSTESGRTPDRRITGTPKRTALPVDQTPAVVTEDVITTRADSTPRENQRENPSGTPPTKPAFVDKDKVTTKLWWREETEETVTPEVTRNSDVIRKHGDIVGEGITDHVTTAPVGLTSSDDDTDYDGQVSLHSEQHVTARSSIIPETGEVTEAYSATSGHDVTDSNATVIPQHGDDASGLDQTDPEEGGVTSEQDEGVTARSPKRAEFDRCSTKHHSKSRNRSRSTARPPRKRNRNRKRTNGRRTQTSTPSSLSLGHGLVGVQTYPFYPVLDRSYPDLHTTTRPIVSVAGQAFPRNSTFTISGLSSAEVTGIAIGCIIAFWILLGPLVCIICRMRDKAQEKRREREQEDGMSHNLIEEMIRMELARGRAKLYRTNVDDEREIERLPLQGDCCNTCNSHGSCVINPQDYVIGNRYMEYTPVKLTPAPTGDYDKEYIINKTYVDSLDTKSSARDTNL